MTTTVLNVPDISCEHCERTTTTTLEPVDGVRDVRVNIPARQVRAEYDEQQVDLERIKALLQEEGSPVASAAEPCPRALGRAPPARRPRLPAERSDVWR